LSGQSPVLEDSARLLALTQEAVTSSGIEGEILPAAQVRSSLARRLGLDSGTQSGLPRDKEGIVLVLLDAVQGHAQPLSAERLFGWHAALFPSGRSGLHSIRVGAWRRDEQGPMQVVSGPLGRETVHFEAPGHERLDAELERFVTWFNRDDGQDLVLKSGLAHLYFVTLHPFDDGNGRLARALSELLLARSEAGAPRYYSLSQQILQDRAAYYQVLEDTQRGDLDVSAWFHWYLRCLQRAFSASDALLHEVYRRTRFWQRHAQTSLNERQRSMLERLLQGFEGKLTSSKWAKLEGCSQDSAVRDLQGLVDLGILQRVAGGRSTEYRLESA
jgi:Fic family protein